jgi:peptidylprolyl isomerase
VENARPEEWHAIAANDLLVMTLTPDGQGRPRRVVIQLMPAPISAGWVENIRLLARAHWWDGLAVVRVQDNYVTQWGDPDGEDAARARALPAGLRVMTEADYLTPVIRRVLNHPDGQGQYNNVEPNYTEPLRNNSFGPVQFANGWPVGHMTDSTGAEFLYPAHCYGMVGVGRNLSPDTGSGAELYTVIGHAPRHLDANIALVGRVIDGMPHLSSLPRGTGPLGFYETPAERTLISSIRLASELPAAEQPRFEYLSTDSQSFGLYADARANRRDPFFIRPAGGADVCNIPVPVRRVAAR